MKKIFAIALSVLLLVGMLAGCGKNTSGGANGTTAPGGAANVDLTERIVGSLVLTANASVTISYDAAGYCMQVVGNDAEGTDLLAGYEDLVGVSCSEVITRLIRDSAARSMGELHYIMVKDVKGSASTEKFWSGIKTITTAVRDNIDTDIKLVLVSQDMQDAKGQVNLKTAKTLVEGYLNASKLDSFDGTSAPVDGYYSFRVTCNGVEEELHLNALTGRAADGILTDFEVDPDQITDPKEEQQNATEPTTAPTQP